LSAFQHAQASPSLVSYLVSLTSLSPVGEWAILQGIEFLRIAAEPEAFVAI
jgi:hypothetical protein